MRAIIWTKFGPPETLKFVNLPNPVPRDNEILIKVYATSVHRGDIRIRAFDVPYPWWAKFFIWIFLSITMRLHPIMGLELSGKVTAVGKKVTNFKIGDEVYADVSSINFGGYAEYRCMPADKAVAIKPTNLTFEQAAVIPAGGITSLGMIKNAGIGKGHKVLIYGASGSLGTYCIQICKYLQAEVTGVCSGKNIKLIREIGADKAIDYKKEDYTKLAEKYDFVIDAVGKTKKDLAGKILKSGGVFLDVHKDPEKIKGEDFKKLLLELKEMCESGAIKPVIDKIYNFEDMVEAHRYVRAGHKRGNVAVRIVK